MTIETSLLVAWALVSLSALLAALVALRIVRHRGVLPDWVPPGLIILACLLAAACLGSCAGPSGAWAAGGAPRAAELGVLSNRDAAIPGGPRWEAALGFSHIPTDNEECSPLEPAIPGTNGGGHGADWKRGNGGRPLEGCDEHNPPRDEITGRLGIRWYLDAIGLPAVHAGGGLETDLRPYLRLGVERRLAPQITLGLDLLDRDGRFEGLVGVRFDR